MVQTPFLYLFSFAQEIRRRIYSGIHTVKRRQTHNKLSLVCQPT